MSKKYAQYTSPYTSLKHEKHHEAVDRILSGPTSCSLYADLNAGPGGYTPSNSKVIKTTTCSGFYTYEKHGRKVRCLLWENNKQCYNDLYHKVKQTGFYNDAVVSMASNGTAFAELVASLKEDEKFLVYADNMGLRKSTEVGIIRKLVKFYPGSIILHHFSKSADKRASSCSYEDNPFADYLTFLFEHKEKLYITKPLGRQNWVFVLASNENLDLPEDFFLLDKEIVEIIKHEEAECLLNLLFE